MTLAGHCKHFRGAQLGQGLCLVCMSCVLGMAMQWMYSFPLKALTQSWNPFSVAHTHMHMINCIFSIISANHPCLFGQMEPPGVCTKIQQGHVQPQPAGHRLCSLFAPTTASFYSQQTITALGPNLPVLTMVGSRLGTSGTLGAGMLLHSLWT